MRTYILKRLLLMIPTLFGVSLVIWLLVTIAPGDEGAASPDEAQSQEGTGGGESRRIFRAQFNLDKPLFWNDYVDLTPEEVLAAVRTAKPPPSRPPARTLVSPPSNVACCPVPRPARTGATPWRSACGTTTCRGSVWR